MRVFVILSCLAIFAGRALAASPALSGAWTGFMSLDGSNPLYDHYTLTFSANNTVTIRCDSAPSCGWTSGVGVYDEKDLSVKVELMPGSITLSGRLILNSATQCGWTDESPSVWGTGFPYQSNCTLILWDNKSSWVLLPQIETVHLIFMNHLDVGYNGIPKIGLINNIMNIYFQEYFPRAVAVGKELVALNHTERLVWTTHAWLVDLYLDCPPNLALAGIRLICPNKTEIENVEYGIRAGFITWHRGPMNMQNENGGPQLFEYSLSIATDLDAKFGFPPKITISQRDVPGTTKGVVPLAAKHGVKAYSIGVNGGSCGADLPRAFVWKVSGAELLTLFHTGGYPNNPGPTPQNAQGLARRECVVIKGFNQALCWAFRTDNSGPPMSVAEVQNNFYVAQSQFPGSKVVASTFDNFVNEVLKVDYHGLLPEFEGEQGDVWLQGIQSDPLKLSQFRAFSRALSKCVEVGKCLFSDPIIKNCSRFVVKLPEHTFGLPDLGRGAGTWSNAHFQADRAGAGAASYKNCEAAWIEQRQFTDIALNTLLAAKHPLAEMVMEELGALKPQRPNPETMGFVKIANMTQTFQCQDAVIGFDGTTGAISTLFDGKVHWASSSSTLAKLVYTTWDESGYNANVQCNNVLGGKRGSNEANPKNADWQTSMTSLWAHKSGSQTCSFLVQTTMPQETITNYGGFQEAWMLVNVSKSANLIVDIDYQWFDKTATRLAESFMLDFMPLVQNASRATFTMDKLDTNVSFLEVAAGGAQYQHGVWKGVAISQPNKTGTATANIQSMDVSIVSPITATVKPTPLVDNTVPVKGPILGFGFNIFNNVWNTNYIFYYPFQEGDENLRSRFRITL